MASVPRLHQRERPEHIPGEPPSLADPPAGCRFADRCPSRFDKCRQAPGMYEPNEGQQVRCWLHAAGGRS